MHGQRRDGRRRHARHAAGAAEGRGPGAGQAMLHLSRQARDRTEIERVGDRELLLSRNQAALGLMPAQIGGVERLGLHLGGDIGRQIRQPGEDGGCSRDGDVG